MADVQHRNHSRGPDGNADEGKHRAAFEPLQVQRRIASDLSQDEPVSDHDITSAARRSPQ